MPVTFKFVPNPAISALVLDLLGVQYEIKADAEKVADLARQIAPVETGAFRDSIHVEQMGTGWAVVADSVDNEGNIDAGYIEFGTSDTPPHGTLRNALGAI